MKKKYLYKRMQLQNKVFSILINFCNKKSNWKYSRWRSVLSEVQVYQLRLLSKIYPDRNVSKVKTTSSVILKTQRQLKIRFFKMLFIDTKFKLKRTMSGIVTFYQRKEKINETLGKYKRKEITCRLRVYLLSSR